MLNFKALDLLFFELREADLKFFQLIQPLITAAFLLFFITDKKIPIIVSDEPDPVISFIFNKHFSFRNIPGNITDLLPTLMFCCSADGAPIIRFAVNQDDNCLIHVNLPFG